MSAQIYSQAVTFVIQLGSVPLLIFLWGIETYGVWLILTAIPTYLAFSDFGFTFIAKNDMAMHVSADRRDDALVTFQSILALLLLVIVSAGLLLFAVLAWVPLADWLNLGGERGDTAILVLGAQILSVLLYQLCLLFYAGVRCEGRAATETYFAASWRLADALVIIGVAAAGGGLGLAALAGLGVRIVNLLVLARWLSRTTPWLSIGFEKADRKRIRALAGPSLTYMLVPVSNALLIQGPIIILGAISSPATVALFSVTRTVTRLGMAAANMVNFAFTPEYSFAFGRKDRALLRKYLTLHGLVAVLGSVSYLLVMYFLGDRAISLLSHEQVLPVAQLTFVMAFGVFAEMLWSALFAPLSAINAHREVAIAMVGLSAPALVISTLLLVTPIALAAAVSIVHVVLVFVAAGLFWKVFAASAAQSRASVGEALT